MAIAHWQGSLKPWNWSTRCWCLAIVLAMVVSPAITRWVCLWQVPDIALPFNVDDVIRDEIPQNEDAMVRYTSAVQRFRQSKSGWLYQDQLFKSYNETLDTMRFATEADSPKWDDRLSQLLLANREVLNEYFLATEMERSSGPSLNTADWDEMAKVQQMFPILARLCGVEAVRLERSGELAASWNFQRANLRCARHAEATGFVICRLICHSIRRETCPGIARWAGHSSLTFEQLQVARKEVSREIAERIPISDFVKADYLALRSTLRRDDAANFLVGAWNTSGPYEPWLLFGKRWALWTIGEPEFAMRLARQELVNVMDQVDLPIHMRSTTLRSQDEIIFELGQGSRRVSGQLSPAQLNAVLEAYLTKLKNLNGWFLNIGGTDTTYHCDQARFVALDVVLAAQQYQRKHGEFPESLERFVPAFLDAIPFDPLDKTGTPLRYRVEESGEAIVWSIGSNRIDDGGDISTNAPKDIGFRIRLNKTTNPENNNR